MAVPSVSQLSVATAVEFDEYVPSAVKALFSVDDVDLSSCGFANGSEPFAYGALRFVVRNDTYVYFQRPSHTRLTVTVQSTERAEWQLLYQMRIRTGVDENLKVVDKAVIEFTPNGRPVTVDVTHEVRFLKFELRTINKLILPHPNFDEGDVTISFSDGKTFRTWRSLLCKASPYMADRLADPSVDCLEVGNFSSGAFRELLLQLYPTNRSIDASFYALAKASLAFKVDELIYQLSNYLVEYNHTPMALEEKWKAALDMELHPALEELVVRSVRCGHWDRLLKGEFDPQAFFSPSVYSSIVYPAVLNARCMGLLESKLINTWKRPYYFSAGDSLTAAIVFRGTKFYVNSGLLATHGTSGFSQGPNGQLIARFSMEMQNCCASGNIIPGEVLVALFDSLHLGGPPVEPKYLRAAVIFCHDHSLTVAKKELEQRLLLEPAVSSQHFLQQIRFAERFRLENMLRNCIFRAESSCHEFASRLAQEGFIGVSEDTKFKILERLCSGWALLPKYVNNLGIRAPTSFRQRDVRLDRGGALGFEEHINEGTLIGLDSDYAFGPVAKLQAV